MQYYYIKIINDYFIILYIYKIILFVYFYIEMKSILSIFEFMN